MNFVNITHRFPTISSQAHVEYQAESQHEWKRQDRSVKEVLKRHKTLLGDLLLEAEEGLWMDPGYSLDDGELWQRETWTVMWF